MLVDGAGLMVSIDAGSSAKLWSIVWIGDQWNCGGCLAAQRMCRQRGCDEGREHSWRASL